MADKQEIKINFPIAALQENLKKYENTFGELKAADEPKETIDFEGAYL